MKGTDGEQSDARLTDPAGWNRKYGDCLFRYAVKHVGDPHKAQDLVQETWLAAWQARDRFAGRSTERTWLFGILRHKLIDHYQTASRESRLSEEQRRRLDEMGTPEMTLGPSAQQPAWMDPSAQLDRKQLRRLLDRCLCRLTDRMKAVFAFCDLDEVPPREVARRLGLTDGHLYVLLHRARQRVRECLSV